MLKIIPCLLLLSTVTVAKADVIKLSAGTTVAPYIMEPTKLNKQHSGFEIDIIREALKLKGHQVEFLTQPLERSKVSFKQGKVDGVIDIKKHYPEIKGAYVSDDHIVYENYAISLKSRKLNIKSIKDLSTFKVVAFQQANIAFGKEFETMAGQNKEYFELPNQRGQVSMLYANRVDVIVIDKRIFQYITNNLKRIKPEPVIYHEIFKPSFFAVAFRKKKIRDDFNEGLQAVRKSGLYNKIVAKYLKKYNKK